MIQKATYIVTIILILATPFIYSSDLYNGIIYAKQFWFLSIMVLLMLVTAFDILFSRRLSPRNSPTGNKKEFTFNFIDIALLAFYTYYLIRSASTLYTPLLENQRFINWTLSVILYFIVKRIINNEIRNKGKLFSFSHSSIPPFFGPFIVHSLIITGFIQAIWGLLQLYGILLSFNSNFNITGTFFNPAPYAMYLAVIFPMALWQITKNETLRIKNAELRGKDNLSFLQNLYSLIIFYISLATVITILLVLPATMIRAAWLGAMAGSLVVLQYRYHYIQIIRQFLNNSFRRIIAFLVTLTFVALFGVSIFFLKKDSASGKLFIWEITISKIVEKPLFGYGVGRFEAEYNNWQAGYFQKHPQEAAGYKGWLAGNTKYCFNEFLELTSEVGLIGLLLLLLVNAMAFGGMKKISMKESKIKNESLSDSSILNSSFLIHNYLCPSFFSIFILAFFSFPFYNNFLLQLFFIILALIAGNIPGSIALPKKLTIITTGIFIIILFTSSIWLAKTIPKTYTAYKTWQQSNFLFEMSDYDASAKEFEKAYPQLNYNGDFLHQYGKCLSMAKQYQKAEKKLTNTAKLTTDYVLFTNLGNVYKERKQYARAEEMYTFSACMIPHKLYSHYLLAKLYDERGERAKALQKATEVLAKNVKVENIAAEEIKHEMRKIIMK